MAHPSVSRRRLLQTTGVLAAASAAAPLLGDATAGAAVAPARADIGVSAYPFDLGQVRLTTGRWLDNQNRTLAYLQFVDVNRMLYNFRANHRLSTAGAAANGGWDAPNFPFRTHMQGHLLTAWAQAYAVLGDTTCRDKANAMVAGLAACQANNGAAGFSTGYLSGFPESDFTALENGTLSNGNVPWYCIHKTLAGLLDVWRLIGSTQARDVLLALAGWVDWRTGRLSASQMQNTLGVEFGGMNAVLADLYQQTGDARWLTTAQRFDHASVFNPLASNTDQLNGLHANTQVPKWIGAAREYKATGTTRYRDIAANAWNITVAAHTYVIGGNSQAEHFRAPNAIAAYLTNDTCEQCNTYNMLKLTRELWLLNPDNAAYFDFYERALINHLIGAQNPADSHGHVTYFTPLKPGGRRGVGPAWGGGTWSTDYNSFWCCQGTGVETNTKLMESIYFYNGTTLTVNLFTPSVLNWSQRGITVTQSTTYPVSDTTTLTVTGTAAGTWTMRIRIPAWTSGATVSVNGTAQSIATTPGTYASLTRSWTSGDTVTVRLPMQVAVRPANDNANVVAVTYGPVVLAGNYGDTALSALPSLNTASVTRTGSTSLAFTATANGATVALNPFQDAHGYNYTVYWSADGQGTGSGVANYRLVNAASGLVLGVQNMSTADGGLALQWTDNGTADHNWELVTDGTAVRLRNVNSGKVLGVQNMSTADNAVVLQWADNGTADHRWTVVDNGDGSHKLRNVNSGKVLAIQGNSTANGAQAVQAPDDGGTDNLWRFVPNGSRRIQNLGSGLVLGVQNMSTASGGLILQWGDTGTADHLWTAVVDSGGYLRLRNANSGLVLGVENGGTANGTRAVQLADTSSADRRWRLRYGTGGYFRIQSANGGRVLGVNGASTAQGAQVLIWDDNGTNDHLWRFI
ncbi:glycoside hydrolase family 127 protein [Dactylosporangium aurantiacum]|uniref:Glycoside hydrolase family 127 protein n=1 Tax=Dactylosporangium aurantiacum TaxID=35754 RepID=A0A9Q9IN21_9ACTN|nr:beta-L-arabinofuranosidase domain-containing protein [Dactylosporangium aurantiacum]MDG6108602.1 glycoside hydrolase family 127 protein [Dactylosporangium aurantiacum]UWZ59177.1 glycoside hydrolase family 127 protein [Dactylosporangium aurantiacum]